MTVWRQNRGPTDVVEQREKQSLFLLAGNKCRITIHAVTQTSVHVHDVTLNHAYRRCRNVDDTFSLVIWQSSMKSPN